MEELLLSYRTEILWTAICLLALSISRFLSIKAIRKVGRISEMDRARTRLIIKYVIIGHSLLFIFAMVFIWGVNFRELGLIFSSVFAVIGVALFASWSILSNITAGVILFFTFPYKIGDRIRIHDKELDEIREVVIEDIRAFHVHLRLGTGELLTYPNNLFLQKAVSLMPDDPGDGDGSEAL
ncbi:mechanosensitive ion channel domain-containing protein [Robiginitalea sp. SC105]|uniref:mechanosensitive ion channel domain-containing protein n=1 Tax=Robiginitalea sp. SC105 TaxID=2762332 RepID=UPI0016397D01|nr:mechanosensitive ion channel domain-containing protein [Robiginitalea sp. SC105]MBC2840389.1 mechanosensitive ion channel [Robiginitalea sp. SC105]